MTSEQRLALVVGELGVLALQRLDRGVPHRIELLVDGDRRGRGAGRRQLRRIAGGRGRALLGLDALRLGGRGRAVLGVSDLAGSFLAQAPSERPARQTASGEGELRHGQDPTIGRPRRTAVCYTPASAMRHLYADFIDRVAKPMRYLGGEYQSVVKETARSTRACASRSPTSTTSGCPTSGRRSSTRCSTAIRGSRASARSRRGPTWRPSCARAACRWCRSRRQRPLCEFDVLGISLQYELTFTNVLTLLDLGGIPLRAADRARRRHARARRRADGVAPRAGRAVHRRGVHRRGRGAAAARSCSRGPRCAARSAPGTRTRARRARRARVAVPALRAVAVRDRDRRRRPA